MATRQQLRGDGSKEYQIITNLSRGINNAVADDVLVDNAFRDVVNFSSDQLGNISKRDNLLNSNFKEFIRKLAYGDFNLDTFNINRNDSTHFSYGRIEQTKLQNFYETLFTDKPYWRDTAYINYKGVAKSASEEYIKIAEYNNNNRNANFTNDYSVGFRYDANIIKDTGKYEEIIEHNLYQDEHNILYYTYAFTGEKIKIVESSVPNGWTLSDDKTTISKLNLQILSGTPGDYYETPIDSEGKFLSSEDVSITLDTSFGTVIKKTSIAAQNDATKSSRAYPLTVTRDETDDTITFKVFYINSYGRRISCYGVSGDEGWTPYILESSVDNKKYVGVEKTFNKQDLPSNFSKNIRFVFSDFYQDFCLSRYNVVTTVDTNESQGESYKNYYYFTGNVCLSNTVLKCVYILNQDNFLKQLQNLDELFKEGNYSDNTYLKNDIILDAYFIGYGDVKVYTSKGKARPDHQVHFYSTPKDNSTSSFTNALIIYRVYIKIDKNYAIDVQINSRTVGDDYMTITKATNNIAYGNHHFPNSYVAKYTDADVLSQLFISKYNNYIYLCTGYASIVKIDINPNSSFGDDSIVNIGAYDILNTDFSTLSSSTSLTGLNQNNLYKPVPYEIINPGFNLIADDTLSCVETTGSVDKIRGVFYSINLSNASSSYWMVEKEPLQTVPCNIPFNIHIIKTGDTTPSTPQIRPNNGELDEEKNPYTNLKGTWRAPTLGDFGYFECEGIDTIEPYEMRIKLGSSDEYITYFTPEPYVPKDTGTVAELSDLVFSCPRSKIINNQLVLFGKGGYIFFSDFDNFEYFPSYYYLYVASGTDEEIVDIVYFRQFYAIFTNKRILRMSGDFAADNFEIGPLNDFMGCVNHNTIRQVYNSLYFVGYNGIYSLNQGYLGSGTENLKRIDTQLVNTFNFDNVSYCYVLGSTYIIIMSDGKTWYTYDVDNDMFLRYDYSLEDSVTLANISFIETLEENQIYAILTTNKEGVTFADDLLLYNFPLAKDVNYDYKDSDQGYISSFETPYINLGSPTNTKKFKNLFIKMYNETDSLIPLYVTVYVDDILAITPEDYTIELDEETNTYYYYFKVDNNAELLKAHNLLGELTLGKDTLGDNIIQQLKLKINAKGRAIKIILADGYDYPNKDNSAIIKYRNNKKFSISTIGIVYKLKKVKEG